MEKLNFRSIAKILPKRQRNQLWLLSFARIMANGLDLAGLAGIALLATAFGSIASGTGQSPLVLPIVGEVIITEFEAVLISIVVASTFLLKSLFAVLLNLRIALTIASLETRFADLLSQDFFLAADNYKGTLGETVSGYQTSILIGTGYLSGYLKARIDAIAEGTLLIALIGLFFLVNPVATIGTLFYLSLVLFIMNRFMNSRLRLNNQRLIMGSEGALQKSRDMFGVGRELRSSGLSRLWLTDVLSSKRMAAEGNALTYVLNTLPRYVVETSLILGIFAFMGAVVIVSDLATQAVTIGVFMAGGLRLIASVLPLQGAYSAMVGTGAAAQVAFNKLLNLPAQVNLEDVSIVSRKELPRSFDVVFHGVSYEFPGAQDSVVSEMSFTVEANSKTAIVGPSGAGKTTTFELATGFRLPSQGSITVAGFSPRNLLEKTSGVIGIVPQRPHLVTGTLAENVSLESAASTEASKVIECLEKAGLDPFIGVDGKGLEVEIAPDSGQLSGGEIQRLGLARALYRDPRILFLDEATSALDAETESRISKVLDSLRSQMTVVLIAHRLSTVMNADKIIYLDKGKVVAQGTFAELKQQVPDFAKAVQLMDLGE